MTILTREQMMDRVMKALDESTENFSEDKKEEIKAGLLEAWGRQMGAPITTIKVNSNHD